MTRKNPTQSANSISNSEPGTGRKPRVLPRTPPTFNTLLDEYEPRTDRPGPGNVIKQVELDEYVTAERELQTQLEELTRMRRKLMIRLWEGAVVEDGPRVAGLMPNIDRTRRPRSSNQVREEILFENIVSSHSWKGRWWLLVEHAAEYADFCRLHSVSKDCPEGLQPLSLFDAALII